METVGADDVRLSPQSMGGEDFSAFQERAPGCFFFIGVGNGLVLPSGIAGAVSVKPDLAGAAAGLAGSLQIGFGALVAPFVGATLDTTVWPLITIMTVCSLLAAASLGLVAGRRRSSPSH